MKKGFLDHNELVSLWKKHPNERAPQSKFQRATGLAQPREIWLHPCTAGCGCNLTVTKRRTHSNSALAPPSEIFSPRDIWYIWLRMQPNCHITNVFPFNHLQPCENADTWNMQHKILKVHFGWIELWLLPIKRTKNHKLLWQNTLLLSKNFWIIGL